jgi:hypothetical protein
MCMDQEPTLSIRDLYPSLSNDELAEAEENIDRYLAVVLRIFERLELDNHTKSDKLTPPNGTLSCIPSRSESSS